MSDVDEGGLSSEAQEQQPAVEDQQPDTAYEQEAHMQQAAFLASLKGKKKYTPPMPDENTFDTQEEFVKSLVPVPISSIPEVDRKCPHCWKRFGETDPGYDNAEDPVKFRCGHAFGEKCMKEVFRLPIPVKVELHPLSFGSGSRGAKLGHKLEKLLAKKAKQDGTATADPLKVMEWLVTAIETHEKDLGGAEILGADWYALIHEIVMTHHHLFKIHLLENGVVYDVHTLYPAPLHVHSFENFPSTMPPISIETEVQTLILDHLEEHTPGHDAYSVLYGTDADWDSGSSTPSSIFNMPGKSKAAGPKLSAGLQTATATKKQEESAAPAPQLSSKSPTSNVSPSTTTSSNVAPSPPISTNLTKTSSPGPKQSSSATSPSSILAPKPATSLPNAAPSSSIPNIPFQFTAAPDGPNFDIGSFVPPDMGSFIPAILPGTGGKPSHNKTTVEIYESANNYLKEHFPDAPLLPALVDLQVEGKKAMDFKKEQFDKSSKAAQEKADQAQKTREIRRKAKNTLVATALVNVLEEYRKSPLGISEPRSPSLSPPPKKHKANSFVPPQLNNMIHAVATVHKRDVGAAHYDIQQPYDSMADISDVESDHEGGAESDTGNENDEGNNAQRMVVLIRSLCSSNCCYVGEEASRSAESVDPQLGTPPETVGWKDAKSTPDCCPLCKKILFKRSGVRRGGW